MYAVWYDDDRGGDVEAQSDGTVAYWDWGVVGLEASRVGEFMLISLRSTFSYTFFFFCFRARTTRLIPPLEPGYLIILGLDLLNHHYNLFTSTLRTHVTRVRIVEAAVFQILCSKPRTPRSFIPCFHSSNSVFSLQLNSASFIALIPLLHRSKSRLARYGRDKTLAGASPYSS